MKQIKVEFYCPVRRVQGPTDSTEIIKNVCDPQSRAIFCDFSFSLSLRISFRQAFDVFSV